MKNQSRFDETRKLAVAAIGGLFAALAAMQNKPQQHGRHVSERTATPKPVNNVAGAKMEKAASRGTLGMGHHSGGKAMAGYASGGVATFSPKRDIAKGPARTLSERHANLIYTTKRVHRRDVREHGGESLRIAFRAMHAA